MRALWWDRRSRRMVVVWGMVLLVATVKPLRNTLLYPVWPSQWRPVSSYRILERHIVDFFYPMDRQLYSGPCQDTRRTIHALGILQKAEHVHDTCRVYTQSAWTQAMEELSRQHDTNTMRKLNYFRPSLTEVEQRANVRNLFVLTSVLDAFNVSYVAAGGTLIGSLRHHGMIPWDDDADVAFPADQWQTAKRVLSCVPGYAMEIRFSLLWKFYALDSPLWKGETTTRFPFVDLFPYVVEEDYVWSLDNSFKFQMMWPPQQVFPTKRVTFDNFLMRVPHDVAGVLSHLYGDVRICQARLLKRREKRWTTSEERVRVECSILRGVYPLYDREDDEAYSIAPDRKLPSPGQGPQPEGTGTDPPTPDSA